MGVWLVLLGVMWLRPLWALVMSITMMLSWVSMSAQLLSAWQLWLDPTPALATVLLFLPLWAWRRTSVMAHMVQHETASLHRQGSSIGPPPKPGSGEFVVQQALLLGQAVDAINSELNLLSSVIEELPEAVAIVSVRQGLLLQNHKLLPLLTHQPLQSGHSLQQVCTAMGVDAQSLALNTTQMLHLPLNGGMGEFLLRVSPVQTAQHGDMWVLVLSDVTQLRQIQAQRDQALQFLSHDMRTPLASILTLVRQPNVPAYKIEQHAHKLLQMMDDFCMTVAADAPSYKLQPELLETLLDDALERVSDLADAKHVALSHHNSAEAVFVQANAQLLVRALTNLLQNAVKFAPLHSTVEVRVAWQAAAQDDEHAVRIHITNAVERRQHDTTLPGFGLGLAFVQKVVGKHGGQMVRDIPQHGEARVTLELPCTADGMH
jgi:signal transduction histidine kinase